MANDGNLGPLGSDTNQPAIDGGTNALTKNSPPGAEGPQMYAYTPTAWESAVKNTSEWFAEANEAAGNLVWWLIGSPALGLKNGDLEFGPEDSETKHMRNTPAFVEAVEIYQDWIAHGRPLGEYSIHNVTCYWVPSKGHFFVQGRTGGGQQGRKGKLSEPLAYPLWGYTGNFSIRFKEADWMGPNLVQVEMENYTSLPSYLHGLDQGNAFLDSLYTRESGVPIVSRSRQVYRFITYIAPKPPAPASK